MTPKFPFVNPKLVLAEVNPKLPFVAVGAAVVAAGVGAIVVLSSGSPVSLLLPGGTINASIQIVVPSTGAPTFSGTIAGRTLTGSVTGVRGTAALAAGPGGGETFTYAGALAGSPYTLHVSLAPVGTPPPPNALDSSIKFNVSGNYGSKAVHARAALQVGSAPGLVVPVSGTVGTQSLMGTATASSSSGSGSSRTFVVTANITVS